MLTLTRTWSLLKYAQSKGKAMDELKHELALPGYPILAGAGSNECMIHS